MRNPRKHHNDNPNSSCGQPTRDRGSIINALAVRVLGTSLSGWPGGLPIGYQGGSGGPSMKTMVDVTNETWAIHVTVTAIWTTLALLSGCLLVFASAFGNGSATSKVQ